MGPYIFCVILLAMCIHLQRQVNVLKQAEDINRRIKTLWGKVEDIERRM